MASEGEPAAPAAQPEPTTLGIESIPTWTEYFKEKVLGNGNLKSETETETGSKATATGVEVGVEAVEEKVYKADEGLNGKVSIWQGDITKLSIGAIVNAANEELERGGGVCGAIHQAAGDELQDECDALKGCLTGSAKITKGYKLPAKHVIHAVGPMREDPGLLRSCYGKSLQLLLENELRSVAFPCISTGIYGYPNKGEAHIALEQTRVFLEKNGDKVDRVIFCVFLKKDLEIYETLLQKYFPVPAPVEVAVAETTNSE